MLSRLTWPPARSAALCSWSPLVQGTTSERPHLPPSHAAPCRSRATHHSLHPLAAFYDGPVLITSLQVIKKFILLADVLLGLSFLTYSTEVSVGAGISTQDLHDAAKLPTPCHKGLVRTRASHPPPSRPPWAQERQFVLLSKDAAQAQPAATSLLVSGKRLHLVMAGLDGTLRMLGYDPTHADSWKGQRLVHRWGGSRGAGEWVGPRQDRAPGGCAAPSQHAGDASVRGAVATRGTGLRRGDAPCRASPPGHRSTLER